MWYIIGFFVLAQLVVFLIRQNSERVWRRISEHNQPCTVINPEPLRERLRRVRADFAGQAGCRKRHGWRERFHLHARQALQRLAYFRRSETHPGDRSIEGQTVSK